MVNENFSVTGACEAVFNYLVSLLHGNDVQDFDTRWDHSCYQSLGRHSGKLVSDAQTSA